MEHAAPLAAGLHAGWCNFLDAAQAAGLLRELSYGALWRRLGVDAMRAPDPGRFAEVLHGFFEHRDPVRALARRRAAGYAVARAGEPLNATRWLARLIAAAPVLSGVRLERRPFDALRRGPRLVRLGASGGWVELADVVDAANVLLEGRTEERLVPLRAAAGREAYVRLDRARAAWLDEAGLLEADWVDAFADELPRAA
jgi:hypothetical protein